MWEGFPFLSPLSVSPAKQSRWMCRRQQRLMDLGGENLSLGLCGSLRKNLGGSLGLSPVGGKVWPEQGALWLLIPGAEPGRLWAGRGGSDWLCPHSITLGDQAPRSLPSKQELPGQGKANSNTARRVSLKGRPVCRRKPTWATALGEALPKIKEGKLETVSTCSDTPLILLTSVTTRRSDPSPRAHTRRARGWDHHSCTYCVTTKRQSVKREMDQSGLFVKQIQKNPIIILELKKKVSHTRWQSISCTVRFLTNPRGFTPHLL